MPAVSLVRKIKYSSEFMEGWAFYGEELFVQPGLYGDNLDGRYYTAQSERVRGARNPFSYFNVHSFVQEWQLRLRVVGSSMCSNELGAQPDRVAEEWQIRVGVPPPVEHPVKYVQSAATIALLLIVAGQSIVCLEYFLLWLPP